MVQTTTVPQCRGSPSFLIHANILGTSPAELALHVPLSSPTKKLCNFFFGHVFRNERTERVWTTHKFKENELPPPTHTPPPSTHPLTNTPPRHTMIFKQVSPPAWRLRVFKSLCYRKTLEIQSGFFKKPVCVRMFFRIFPARRRQGHLFENPCVFLFTCAAPQRTTKHRDTSQHTTSHHTSDQQDTKQSLCQPFSSHDCSLDPAVRSRERTHWSLDPLAEAASQLDEECRRAFRTVLFPSSRCPVAPGGKTPRPV